MAISPEQALADLGLQGPYQVHIFPTVLVGDRRGHQIFVGFDAHALKEAVQRLGLVASPIGTDPAVVAADSDDHPGGLAGLAWVVEQLMAPDGCPWDREQTHQSLKKYLIEEAHELFEAIDSGYDPAIQEEIGDVLLQPLMHAGIAAKEGRFSLADVADAESDKLIRRHPHVFGDVHAETPEEVLQNWDAIKRQEKQNQNGPKSILGGIPQSLPALMLALEVSKRAARSGFEWPSIDAVWEKFHEEEREFREALAQGDSDEIRAELGDLLFTTVNLARWANVDPEDALRSMVARFRQRFGAMESLADRPLRELSPEEWDVAWNRAKSEETR